MLEDDAGATADGGGEGEGVAEEVARAARASGIVSTACEDENDLRRQNSLEPGSGTMGGAAGSTAA